VSGGSEGLRELRGEKGKRCQVAPIQGIGIRIKTKRLLGSGKRGVGGI